MKATIFGSLHPFFERGHINGRTMANAGFMTALLRRDPFDAYHFFVAQPDSLVAELETLTQPDGFCGISTSSALSAPSAPSAPSALSRGAVHVMHRMALPDALRRHPYGVFHFSDPVSEYSALCQARNVWAPEIFPVTAVNHTVSYCHYGPIFAQHLWQGCSPRDVIGCNSRAAKDVLERYFDHLQKGYGDSTRYAPGLRVVPMGVEAGPTDASTDAARRADMRARLLPEENSVLCLLFGRISLADKMDPTPLMLALHRAKNNAQNSATPPLHLVIAGYARSDDNAEDYLRAVAKALNIRCSLLPNPTDEDKRALFAAADIFVSPSDNIQETFGLSLLEAGAAGLPCIASDWDGYRDIIVHGQTGLLVPTLAPASSPELDLLGPLLFENQHHFFRSQQSVVSVPALTEALLHLAAQPSLRRRMGEAARLRVRAHFTWDSVVSAWLELWQELRSRPLKPETQTRLRHSRHPALLPMGEIYAPYATNSLPPEAQIRCTAMGETLRQGHIPFSAFNPLGNFLQEQEVLPLLVWARKPLSVSRLSERAAASAPASPFSPERFHFVLLWALKHDLLEVYPDDCLFDTARVY